MDNTNNQTTALTKPAAHAVIKQPMAQQDQKETSYGASSLSQKEKILGTPGLNTSEFVNLSEPEPRLSAEVKDAGVEAVSDKMPLIEEHQGLGIRHSAESTPVLTQPFMAQMVSNEEIERNIVTTSINDSPHWLWGLIKKVRKQLELWGGK